MEYEKMLDRLYLSLPKHALSRERFELPSPESLIQGNKTFVKNFQQILKLIKRDQKHFFKFATRELGVAVGIEQGRMVLNGRFSQKQVADLLENYLKTCVLCPECGKPDTKFVEHQGIKMMKCEACGALAAVKVI